MQVPVRFQLVLERVGDHILHVLQLALELLEFLVVVLYYFLVALVLSLKFLPLPLDLVQLLAESLGQVLHLLPVLDVLLEFIAHFLALFFL
mgnify:CR=1 FL=1